MSRPRTTVPVLGAPSRNSWDWSGVTVLVLVDLGAAHSLSASSARNAPSEVSWRRARTSARFRSFGFFMLCPVGSNH
jgi:hypothetical protein